MQVETMASRDRLTLDIADLRERIETVRRDVGWLEMSLAQKLRVLIRERLEQLESEMPYRSIAELVSKNRDRLDSYGRIPSDRLDALASGSSPTELEQARLALATGMDEAAIERLAKQ